VPLFAFEGREPDVSPGAWIAPTATLVGDVRVEAEASIWYGAVLRADFGPMLVAGVPARVIREITGQAKRWVETNPSAYRELARRHAAGIQPVPG
jgi:carbonic anhydrase/acetyltransferase-like protein (isoleucine patch superfamily)